MSLDMNPEIRAQWCAALRSGDYQQAKDDLRRYDAESGDVSGHCCLGVLVDLYLKAGNPPTWEDDDGWTDSVWNDGELVNPVQRWAGVSSADPVLLGRHTAASLNDHGKPFAEIADLIDGGAS
jgi:hypothetical protein